MNQPTNDLYAEYYQQVNSLPGQLGGLILGLVQSDATGRFQNVRVIEELAKLANVMYENNVSISIIKEVISQQFSLPAIQNAILSAFLPTTGKIKANLSIHSQQSYKENTQEDGSLTGKGGVGWGPFHIEATLSASYKCTREQQRSTDQSSNLEVEIEMGRVEPAEGTMKIIDAMNNNTEQIIKIEAAAISKQVEAALNAIPGAPNDPPNKKG